ncbi:MAG: response regulator [bacterium]|nr:response regulator [bacterium]
MKTEEQAVWKVGREKSEREQGGGGRSADTMRALARFAAGVAHDFNNVLTVIFGYTDFLMERVHREGVLYAQLEEIKEAAQRAAGLTRLLMMFGGERVFEPVVMNVNGVLSTCEGRLRAAAGERVRVELELCKERCVAAVDPYEFEEALICLAMNAREAMPEGGRVMITTELREEEGRKEVIVRVRDSGTGFSAEALAHACEPFFSTKGDVRNQGLGLFRVYAVMRQCGGWVRCGNHEQGGAEVVLGLPYAEVRRERGGGGRPVPATAGEKVTVMVVEDDERVRTVLREALLIKGYEVVEAKDGEEAWRLIKEANQQVDVVLTDVAMPGMDGHELGARVAELRPEVRIIYMSGFTDDATLRSSVLTRRAVFLQKPFMPQQLIERIREVTGA